MKESGLSALLMSCSFVLFNFSYLDHTNGNVLLYSYSIMALRKAEKEEERRAREKIRQKLEEDKVCYLIPSATLLGFCYLSISNQIISCMSMYGLIEEKPSWIC